MKVRHKVEEKARDGMAMKLPVIIFKEDAATICYCPALDLSGYGHNEKEAIESYKYVVNEYLGHSAQQHTLEKDLKRLGWQIKRNLEKSIVPPPVTKLLANNNNFRRVFEKFDYKKLSTSINFPALSV